MNILSIIVMNENQRVRSKWNEFRITKMRERSIAKIALMKGPMSNVRVKTNEYSVPIWVKTTPAYSHDKIVVQTMK